MNDEYLITAYENTMGEYHGLITGVGNNRAKQMGMTTGSFKTRDGALDEANRVAGLLNLQVGERYV